MSVDDAFRKLMQGGAFQSAGNDAESSVPPASAQSPSAAGQTAAHAAAPASGVQSASATAEGPAAPLEEPQAEPLDLSRVRTHTRFAHHPVDSRSQIAEEYRILRTRLMALDLPKPSIQLTSCHHNEGKTRTALNLAMTLARRTSRKILLVDFDLRRPRLHRLLGLPKRDVDVVSVLRGRCAPEDAMCYSEEDNLYVLAAGREYSNGTDFLETRMARGLIDRLHATFDMIVFDTCPCLSTSDPAIIGPNVGGTLMVVRCLQTQRESVSHAINSLQEVGVPVVGVVLTFMRYFIPRYLYRYQYYHGQYYATSYGYGGRAYGDMDARPAEEGLDPVEGKSADVDADIQAALGALDEEASGDDEKA